MKCPVCQVLVCQAAACAWEAAELFCGRALPSMQDWSCLLPPRLQPRAAAQTRAWRSRDLLSAGDVFGTPSTLLKSPAFVVMDCVLACPY